VQLHLAIQLWKFPDFTSFNPGYETQAPRNDRLRHAGCRARYPAQAIAAQAVTALRWYRQLRGFLGAPAIAGQFAGKFRPATGTGEAARGGFFCPICHDSCEVPPVIFMPGSCRTAL
jgi:hypothetical protein